MSDKHHALAAALDTTGDYTDDGVVLIVPTKSVGSTVLRNAFEGFESKNADLDLRYVLAIILSKLETFYFKKRFATESLQGSTSHTYPSTVRNLPIKNIDKKEQEKFITVVDNILALTQSDSYPKDAKVVEHVKKLEHELNNKVYELYGLTPEEISVIEETKI